jgi:hypothetical protein
MQLRSDVDGLARQRDDVLGRGIRLADLGQLHPRRRDPPQPARSPSRLILEPSISAQRAAQRRQAHGRQREESRRQLVHNRRLERVDVGAAGASSLESVIAGCGTWTGRGLSSSLIRAAGSELQICNGMPNRNTPEIRSRSRRAVSMRPRSSTFSSSSSTSWASIERGAIRADRREDVALEAGEDVGRMLRRPPRRSPLVPAPGELLEGVDIARRPR